MLAIEAGKAVLLEKPFTMDAAEARSLVDAARARGVFLMEAMWARFVPHMVRVRELLAAGALGEVRLVIADHCQWFRDDPTHRLLAPDLGGGALLDLGIYPVSFASMVLGEPAAVTAVSTAAVHRCRRHHLDAAAVRRRGAGRAHHHALGGRTQPGGRGRHRGTAGDRLGVLRADVALADPAGRFGRAVRASRTRGSACGTRRPR